MSKKVRSCELEKIDLTEGCLSELITFLENFQISAVQAQIILEVANYPEYYIDLNTLIKKIPKEMKKKPLNVEADAKQLIKKKYLQPYESKKTVFCMRCTPFGRDVAKMIRDHCYSEKLRYFGYLIEKYTKPDKLLCFDPQGFKEGEKRTARGPKGEKLHIIIKKKGPSERIFRITSEGVPEYEIKLEAEITSCPQCGERIFVEFCYNPNSCYREYKEVHCEKCGFEFTLAYSLLKFLR